MTEVQLFHHTQGRTFAVSAARAELSPCRGDHDLFADPRLQSHDPDEAVLLNQRVLEFLGTLDAPPSP